MNDLTTAMSRARRVVASILRNHIDEVDDVLQTAALHAFARQHQFRGTAKFTTYFVVIARNAALMFLRDKVKPFVPVDVLASIPARGPTPELMAIENQRYRILREEIRNLTPARRRAAYSALRGESTGMNETLKGARFRMRHQLRRALTARGVFGE